MTENDSDHMGTVSPSIEATKWPTRAPAGKPDEELRNTLQRGATSELRDHNT